MKPYFEKDSLILAKPGDPEYEQSRASGFRVQWNIAGEYEIAEGVLRAKPRSGYRDYYPINHKNIPNALEQIEEGDNKALLLFAKQYGLLGFEALAGLWPPLILAASERGDADDVKWLKACVDGNGSVFDHQSLIAWAKGGGGDPLPWVWAHIRTIRLCLELRQLLQSGKGEEESREKPFMEAWRSECLVELLRRIQPQYAKSPHEESSVNFVFASKRHIFGWGPEWNEATSSAKDHARFILRYLINNNVAGISPLLEPEGSRDRRYFEFSAMIQMAYWHLQTAVDGGIVKRCEVPDCGHYFIQTDKRQRFCPPLSAGGESRCAVRARVRKRAAKQKNKGKGRKQTQPKRRRSDGRI